MSQSTIDEMGGLETPDNARKAQLSQVVNYSEFLNELAAQRHTVIKQYVSRSVSYTGYRDVVECNDKLLANIDNLIRDVLRHIEGSDLAKSDGAKMSDHQSAPTTIDSEVDKIFEQLGDDTTVNDLELKDD